MHPQPTRKLSEIEKIFVKEAKDGLFEVSFKMDGTPVAHGAPGNSDMFSMNVSEVLDGEGVQYQIEN